MRRDGGRYDEIAGDIMGAGSTLDGLASGSTVDRTPRGNSTGAAARFIRLQPGTCATHLALQLRDGVTVMRP